MIRAGVYRSTDACLQLLKDCSIPILKNTSSGLDTIETLSPNDFLLLVTRCTLDISQRKSVRLEEGEDYESENAGFADSSNSNRTKSYEAEIRIQRELELTAVIEKAIDVFQEICTATEEGQQVLHLSQVDGRIQSLCLVCPVLIPLSRSIFYFHISFWCMALAIFYQANEV